MTDKLGDYILVEDKVVKVISEGLITVDVVNKKGVKYYVYHSKIKMTTNGTNRLENYDYPYTFGDFYEWAWAEPDNLFPEHYEWQFPWND